MNTELNVFSSEQWFSSLDVCNREAISVMLSSTRLVEHYASQLINYQLHHKKRNVSYRYTWRDNISNLIQFCGDPTLKRFLNLHICRDYIFYMIDDFTRLTTDFRQVLSDSIKHRNKRLQANVLMQVFYKKIGFHGDNDILFVINHVEFLKEEYLNIRDLLIHNYKDYAMSKAVADYKNMAHYSDISIDDMRQNYILPIIKAINKYDIDKGSFKAYLDIWIRKYRDNPTHFMDGSGDGSTRTSFVSFDSDEHRKVDRIIQTREENNAVDIVNQNRQRMIIANLASLVDPKRYAVEYLELGEF